MLSHIDSELGEFKYISFVPEKIFWEKAAYVKRTVFIGLVLCIVIGGVITGISVKKNYNPLKQLVTFLENNNEGPRYDKKSDEYSFIRNTIVQVKQAKEKTDSILNQQKNELKIEFLNRLLQGTTGRKLPTEEILSFYGINFQGDYFVVLVFYLEDFDEAFWVEDSDKGDDSEKETYRLIHYTISNVIENLVGEDSRNHIIGMNDTLVLLLNFSDITSVSKEALNTISCQAVKNLKEQYNIDLSVSISSPHTSIEGIPAAYNEALQVMEYKRLLNAGQVLHYDDIVDMPRGDYYYPLDQEYKLINHIKAGDYENSKKILDNVFRENFESNTPTPVISRCLMFNLVSTMIKTIDEINKAKNKEFIESQTTIDKLLNCENIGTMKEELKRTLRNFCNYIKKNSYKKSEDMDFIESVKDLVSMNYQDYNLSVNYIADELEVHPVHLSKIYKQMTGEGLHDYINRYRTEKAKDLIKQRKYHNLEGVANAVGFTNTRTFTRAFKRAEGITPGKFKEI
jgi:AraC-like DNA-binding protein